MILRQIVARTLEGEECKGLAQFVQLKREIATKSAASLEAMKEDARKMVVTMVEMERSYLTAEVFREILTQSSNPEGSELVRTLSGRPVRPILGPHRGFCKLPDMYDLGFCAGCGHHGRGGSLGQAPAQDWHARVRIYCARAHAAEADHSKSHSSLPGAAFSSISPLSLLSARPGLVLLLLHLRVS